MPAKAMPTTTAGNLEGEATGREGRCGVGGPIDAAHAARYVTGGGPVLLGGSPSFLGWPGRLHEPGRAVAFRPRRISGQRANVDSRSTIQSAPPSPSRPSSLATSMI